MARRLLASLALAAVVGAVPAVANAATPDPTAYITRGVQQVRNGAAAVCRTPLRSAPAAAATRLRSARDPSAPEACAPVDGRTISEAQLAAYESGWVHRALFLQ